MQKYDYRRELEINKIDNKKQLAEFFERYSIDILEPIDWLLLSKRPVFKSLEMIEKYAKYLDWDYLCTDRKFSIDFLERNKDYICWAAVSVFQPITLSFIKKYKDRLLMSHLSRNRYVFEGKDFLKVIQIYNSMKDDPENQKKWYELQQTCFVLKDRHYKSKTTVSLQSETAHISNESAKTHTSDVKQPSKPKKQVENKKSICKADAEPSKTAKRVIVNPKTIEKMTKAELKDILYRRYKIYTKYHTNVPELRALLLNEYNKCQDKKQQAGK